MKFKLPLPSFFARYATCLVASAGLLLSACGGGGTGPDASAGAPAIHRLQITTSVSPSVTVVAVTKLSETRVSRTVYDYVFKITVQNGPQSLSSLKAKLVAVGSGTTILDGDVDVGGIGADAQATPADTIKLRHDRALPFDQAAFRWEFTASSTIALTSLTPRIAETGTGNPVTVSFQEEATLSLSTALSWQFTKLPDGASAPAVTPSNNGLRVVFTPTVHGTYELRATDGVDAISVWVSTCQIPDDHKVSS